MANEVLAMIIIRLSYLDDDVILAAKTSMHGFGRISNGNLAYKPMKEVVLINEDGTAVDSCLSDALAFEFSKRLSAGSF